MSSAALYRKPPRRPRSTHRTRYRSIGRTRSAACHMHGKGSHPAPRSDTTSIKRKHVSQPSTVLVRFRQAQQASPHLALLCAPRAPQWRPQAAFRSRPRSKRRHGALAQAPTVRVHTTPRRSSTMYRVARVVGCMEVPRVQPTNRLPVITPMCMKTGFYVHEDGLLRRVGGRAGGRSYP